MSNDDYTIIRLFVVSVQSHFLLTVAVWIMKLKFRIMLGKAQLDPMAIKIDYIAVLF